MRRRAREKRGKDMLGVAVIGIVLLLLGGVGAGAMLLRTPPHDRATLCLTNKPAPAHTLILVDATDRLDARHRRRLQTVVQTEAARLPRWGRLTVLALRPDAAREPRMLFSGCTPGDAATINPLWENAGGLERQKRARFDEPLAAALLGAGAARSADGSPIVEGLYAAASDPGFQGGARRLVLVSDLLQFRPGGYSLYDATGSWDAYRASPGALRAPPDLGDVDVDVVMLERADRGAAQDNARAAFWTPYFAEARARSVGWQ